MVHGVSSVTVTRTATDSRASVRVPRDDDAGTDGVQVDLDMGSNGIRVTVTAEDGTTTCVYTVVVTRAPPPETVVESIDWQGFNRGTPSHYNARQAKYWLLTTLKYGLTGWWNSYKNFDAQDDSVYLNFGDASNSSSAPEHRIRESTVFASSLAVALKVPRSEYASRRWRKWGLRRGRWRCCSRRAGQLRRLRGRGRRRAWSCPLLGGPMNNTLVASAV